MSQAFSSNIKSDLTNVQIPINTLLNLVESLPRRVEAVIAAKGGPTSY